MRPDLVLPNGFHQSMQQGVAMAGERDQAVIEDQVVGVGMPALIAAFATLVGKLIQRASIALAMSPSSKLRAQTALIRNPPVA